MTRRLIQKLGAMTGVIVLAVCMEWNDERSSHSASRASALLACLSHGNTGLSLYGRILAHVWQQGCSTYACHVPRGGPTYNGYCKAVVPAESLILPTYLLQ
jgi:hypothetical protein